MKKYIRKLRRVGTHSYVITIPKELVRRYRWQEGQNIELLASDKKEEIIVKDWLSSRQRRSR